MFSFKICVSNDTRPCRSFNGAALVIFTVLAGKRYSDAVQKLLQDEDRCG